MSQSALDNAYRELKTLIRERNGQQNKVMQGIAGRTAAEILLDIEKDHYLRMTNLIKTIENLHQPATHE